MILYIIYFSIYVFKSRVFCRLKESNDVFFKMGRYGSYHAELGCL